ncbi:hypothetical protein P3T73_06985 [Kiritimatiellota bacterium B12222]|nr:hypothetical protein P3T73_06985 [Kiritimatiellota bacterium B12222]
MNEFFLKFEIQDEDSFNRLSAAFDGFKSDKTEKTQRSGEDWLEHFSDSELKTFWWPTEQEKEEWMNRWQSTPVPQRFTDPSLVTPWDFESMIEAIYSGEYSLEKIEVRNDGYGYLVFEPFSFPYGGSDSLKALIEAYSHKVIMIEDGNENEAEQ